jgi:hypothetical protein
MALKVLGQMALASNADGILYTVPSGQQAAISTLALCNTGSSAVTYAWVFVIPAGQTLATKHYLYNELAIPAKDTFVATVGLTLGPGDVLRIGTGTVGNLSCHAFGNESTVS